MSDDMDKIALFLRENHIDPKVALNVCKNLLDQASVDKIKETVAAHEQFVGRCFVRETKGFNGMFPPMKQFLKCVSARAENEYRVTCLVFNEYPTYWFKYNAHMVGMAGDYFLGDFEFESVYTDTVMVKELKQFTEIAPEDFDDSLRVYTEELIGMKWVCDHYRFGNKRVTDPDWEVKDIFQSSQKMIEK